MNKIIEITNKYYPLTSSQAEKLSIISEKLTEMNGVLNLTALKTDEEIAILHFFDSLTLLKTGLFTGKSIIDIGCGGGFPSLPLAVCSDKCTVTANDSTAKKLNFVEETVKTIGITNLKTLFGRAEEIARTQKRESFDIAVARGVARLNILCELCLPLVKKGGHFVAMKGSKGAEELEEAEKAIKALGGKTVDIINVDVPLFDRKHTLIVIEKVVATSNDFPRQYAKITKAPL
ncbi:MAG: 16S rRNA (guanine(527)-N(7))-methyltransferase RsmG [Clostridiales bacterium GWF2_36_10]|nr:MAG: 16S rRNA (guanine(527)-N(7))-methyltransferase RsmG [Clostridiales bacterium GWF2_36_10]